MFLLKPGLRKARCMLEIIILLENNDFVISKLVFKAAKKRLFENLAVLLCVQSSLNAIKSARAIL